MKRNERMKQVYPDTKYFKFYNANPKENITGDCVIRALCTAMNKPWDEVYKALCEIGYKKKAMPNNKNVYYAYLKECGWIKCKQLRHIDNTKYSGIDLCKELQEDITYRTPEGEYNIHNNLIVNIGAEHIVAIIDGRINDIWNCSSSKVGVLWYKP